MLRRAKTTRAAGGERKPRAKQQREAEQLQSNEDLAFFGGGLAADSTAEHFTSLEPFGSTADGTQSWRGPSTRHRDTSSMLPPTLSRPRAMSADYADTPRTRLRQTTAQLHGTSAELHLTAQKVMRLERARNVSSGTDGTPGDATPGERVVESTIDPSDLSATWEDRQDGRSDWRECPVSLGQSGKWLEGQTGKVLRAVWKSSIAVAVKEGDWDEMTDEMHLFLDLTHPHVVACYGILTETREKTDHEGRVLPYPSKSIVTERCKVPLEAFLKDHNAWDQDLFGNALDAGMVDMRKYTILHHVALGLQKLHDLKVLHRDIKSGNILLDGAPGTCNSCDHSGLWKICDFGEAKVLKTPSLNFSSPQRFPKGWSHELVKDGRFCRITSPILKQKGARYYCWLRPGEKLIPMAEHDAPPIIRPSEATIHRADTNPQRSHSPVPWQSGDPWSPCSHGGFVYLFSEDANDSDERDCFFDVRDVSSAPTLPSSSFPDMLGPFGLATVLIRPEVDCNRHTFCIDRSEVESVNGEACELPSTELEKLGLLPLTGRISPKEYITLTEGARRQAMLPRTAISFVYAYQCVDDFTQAQRQALQEEGMLDSDVISFVSMGGFIYLDADDVPVGARALRIHSVASRFGTINLPPDDNRITAPVASPELLDGQGIGLETDIYSFGIVMWECFTRREAWHWMSGNAHAIRSKVLVHKKRPKMMPGLSEECADMVRQCLAHNPSSRPTAKQVTEWLDTQRRGLQKEITTKRDEKIRGRDFGADGKLERRLSFGDDNFKSYEITNRDDPLTRNYWSSRGRFSLNKSHGNPASDAVTSQRFFCITVEQTTRDERMKEEWIEDTIFDEQGAPPESPLVSRLEPEPEPAPAPAPEVKLDVPAEPDPERVVLSYPCSGKIKLGIVFGDSFPFVRQVKLAVVESHTKADRTLENPNGSFNRKSVKPGCRLMAICFQGTTHLVNQSEGPTMTPKEAKEIIDSTSQSRSWLQPLELLFEPVHKFGLTFLRKDGHGGWEHTFPEVASIEKMDKMSRPIIFSDHPEIRAGSRLTAINGCPTDQLHENGIVKPETLQLFTMSKVKMKFALGTQVHVSLVKPWIVAGLDAISVVRRQGCCEEGTKVERENAARSIDLLQASLRRKDSELARKNEEIAQLRAALETSPLSEGFPPA